MSIIRSEIPYNYSEIDVNHYFNLTGKYSRRVLKIISRWKSSPSKVITLELDKYREILGIPKDKYRRMESFIRNCVSGPILDVISNSNGDWEAFDPDCKGYVLHRKGRSFNTIQIMLKYNKKSAMDELDENLPF